MIFVSGTTFYNADEMSVSHAPTSVETINYLEMGHGEFREMYSSTLKNCTAYKNSTLFPTPGNKNNTYFDSYSSKVWTWSSSTNNYQYLTCGTFEIPDSWNWETVMHADYTKTGIAINRILGAGNVDWNLQTVNYIMIKRKRSTDMNWIPLKVKSVSKESDFLTQMYFTDKTPTTGTWEYALVPILNTTEGVYSIVDIDVQLSRIVILDKDETYSTVLGQNDFTVTCNDNPGVYSTMYSKYPTIVYNGDANYKTVTMSSVFYPEGDCYFDDIYLDDDYTRTTYVNNVMSFLCNRKPKIIKNIDGQRYLVQITTLPTITQDEIYQLMKFEFGGTEIGDCEEAEGLYNAGFITATEEWWS